MEEMAMEVEAKVTVEWRLGVVPKQGGGAHG